MAIFAQLVISGLAVGCIYGLVALGLVLIYKATEIVNFAQGEFLMLGGFSAYTFITLLGLNYWLGVILSAISLAVFAALLDKIILRRVMGQPQFTIVMLTLGLSYILRSVASMVWGTETYSIATPFSNKSFAFGGVIFSDEYICVVFGAIVICLVLYVFFSFTRLGIAMQASSQSQLAAYYMGIPVERIFSLIWAISGATTAVVGVLLAPISLINIDLGDVGLKAFAAAVIGGFGSIPGALVGGVIVGVVEQLSSVYLSQNIKDSAAYVILLLVLIVWPRGLFGTRLFKRV